MDVRAPKIKNFTHVHYAFAEVTTTFEGDIRKVTGQFEAFKGLKGIKKVIAFGGWTFSTSPATYAIFRQAVTAQNREVFATNCVNFLIQNNLDGLDFDWEYPGAPDIPYIPPAGPDDGKNYLEFLKLVRAKLPLGKSLSIAAPASYWYLKGFPIDEIALVVNYIIYMTYDLHGQWDYAQKWSSSGCPAGNCLRSHINMTETTNALVMITKAGVPTNKIIVGVTSYGRSFTMTDPNCTGPMCTYVGPLSAAKKGLCTDTAGYISNAEIDTIIDQGGAIKTWSDKETVSDFLVYGGTEWVAYMLEENKRQRSSRYLDLKLSGVSDWAIDLQEFLPDGENGRGGEGGNGNGGNGDDEDGGGGGDVIYLPPSVWDSGSVDIGCDGLCTFIFPPSPLPAPETITWPPLTTTLLSSSGGSIHTKTTVISIPTFTITEINYWSVTVGFGDPTIATFTPVQSVIPPGLLLTLPGTEVTFTPTTFPSYSNFKPVTGSSSTTTMTVIPPFFYVSSHTVSIQPQPTILISTRTPIPTPVQFTYAKTSDISSQPMCDYNCGSHDCGLFGCGGPKGCGLFGCGGGCGIFGCGGGCGLLGCGSGCHSIFGCGSGSCPLGSPSGPGIGEGGGKGDGDPDPTSCSTSRTVSDCAVTCSVTDFATSTTTECGSATCTKTKTACVATGITSTSRTTTAVSCLAYVPYTPWWTDINQEIPTDGGGGIGITTINKETYTTPSPITSTMPPKPSTKSMTKPLPPTTTSNPSPLHPGLEYHYDCAGSTLCNTLNVKFCDKAVNNMQRGNHIYTTNNLLAISGNCWANTYGDGCKVVIEGEDPQYKKPCTITGDEMWEAYQNIRAV
ncbi:hypothetical protein V500_02787 [Pseudogymnoascus sp. VKM F-4518 (FW-2643)]|nr:hypothetical protein V500_02787 [Pseudogymnoascus sp. VKM F-4518 (FW-2643)]